MKTGASRQLRRSTFSICALALFGGLFLSGTAFFGFGFACWFVKLLFSGNPTGTPGSGEVGLLLALAVLGVLNGLAGLLLFRQAKWGTFLGELALVVDTALFGGAALASVRAMEAGFALNAALLSLGAMGALVLLVADHIAKRRHRRGEEGMRESEGLKRPSLR